MPADLALTGLIQFEVRSGLRLGPELEAQSFYGRTDHRDRRSGRPGFRWPIVLQVRRQQRLHLQMDEVQELSSAVISLDDISDHSGEPPPAAEAEAQERRR